ncbi:hypothetical protein D9M71_343500 [compost metagenome]
MQLVQNLLVLRADQPVIVINKLIQPSVEGIYSIQLEGKPQQLFAPGGREPEVELVKSIQQIELGQHHIKRQARTQLAAHLMQAGTQHMSPRGTLLGRAMQQRRQVDSQQQAIKAPLASIVQQPTQQVVP